MTNMKHVFDTKNRMTTKRFAAIEKPPEVDTAEIRRQIRLNKDASHAKLPVHHVTLEKLLDAWDAQNGVKDDWRRTIGSGGGDA
jgi:hypothetical protein